MRQEENIRSALIMQMVNHSSKKGEVSQRARREKNVRFAESLSRFSVFFSSIKMSVIRPVHNVGKLNDEKKKKQKNLPFYPSRLLCRSAKNSVYS